MTTRTTLLTSLAAAALLSGTALAQDAQTDGTIVPVPMEDAVDQSTDGMVETDDPTMAERSDDLTEESDGVVAETGTMGGTDEATDDPTMAEGSDGLPEESDGVIAETETGAVEMETADTGAPGTGSTGMFGTFGETRVADLIGLQVLVMDGENVGEVDNLVSVNGEPNAIVGVGGFLGLGEHDVAIPLQRFEMTEDGLVLPDTTEDDIEAMQQWDGETGDEMERDLTVREASS